MKINPTPAEKFLRTPSLIVLITIGFLLEFLVELPFAVLCMLERCFGRKPSQLKSRGREL